MTNNPATEEVTQADRDHLASEYDRIGDTLNANRIRSDQYVCEEVEVALTALARHRLASTPDTRSADVPVGMKPWAGGDSAPDDFNYDPVQFSDGSIGSVSKSSDLWSRNPVSGDPHVTAYTPKPQPPQTADTDVMREALTRALFLRRNPPDHPENADFNWQCAKGRAGSFLTEYYADVDAILAALSPTHTVSDMGADGRACPCAVCVEAREASEPIEAAARAMCDRVNGEGDYAANIDQRRPGWLAQARAGIDAYRAALTADKPDTQS